MKQNTNLQNLAYISKRKKDVVIRMEKGMLGWFGYMEGMDVSKITTQIYRANVGGNAEKGRPLRTYLNQTQKMPGQK